MPVLSANGRLILFIHVPKSAGSSVEGLLASYGTVFGVHQPAAVDLPCNVQHFHAPLLEQVYAGADPGTNVFDYVFMTVRDPLARLTSEFFYRLRFTPGLRASRWPGQRTEVSMGDWIEHSLDDVAADPYLFDNHLRPQHEFATFGAEAFRLEDGLEPVRRALDVAVGKPGRLPERQKTSGRQQRGFRATAPSAATLARVVQVYAGDYDRFGYARPGDTDEPLVGSDR